jgi:hypothetical protein
MQEKEYPLPHRGSGRYGIPPLSSRWVSNGNVPMSGHKRTHYSDSLFSIFPMGPLFSCNGTHFLELGLLFSCTEPVNFIFIDTSTEFSILSELNYSISFC